MAGNVFLASGKDKPWTNAEACELGYEIKRRLG
jgi:hypothetical protein